MRAGALLRPFSFVIQRNPRPAIVSKGIAEVVHSACLRARQMVHREWNAVGVPLRVLRDPSKFSFRGLQMSSACWLFTARRIALFGAVALLAAGAASAQVAKSVPVSATVLSDSSHEAAVPATYSSSNDALMLSDSREAVEPSGMPSAPAPAKGAGGRQAEDSTFQPATPVPTSTRAPISPWVEDCASRTD